MITSSNTNDRDKRIGQALITWLQEAGVQITLDDARLQEFGAHAAHSLPRIVREVEVERIKAFSAVPRA